MTSNAQSGVAAGDGVGAEADADAKVARMGLARNLLLKWEAWATKMRHAQMPSRRWKHQTLKQRSGRSPSVRATCPFRSPEDQRPRHRSLPEIAGAETTARKLIECCPKA
jgi:hypothetical protein